MAVEREIFNQKPAITGWNWGGFAFPLAIGVAVKSPILIKLAGLGYRPTTKVV